jgi:hypothetical protein
MNEEIRVKVYIKCKLLVWISSRCSKDHLMMLLLLSCVELMVVHKVVQGDSNKKELVMENKKYLFVIKMKFIKIVKRVASDCKKGGLYGLQDCCHVAMR